MREAIGPDIDLMCDINQLWSVNHAIEVGRRIEPYHLFWLEDPTAHDDYPGLARIADALDTPIAAGEYHYGIVPFRHLLEARSIDIVMIDLLRVGGITQWMKVAGMAEAFNLPVVSHLIPEIHVHLVAAIPNGLTVEYMPWTLQLFEETPAIEHGPARGAEEAGPRPGLRPGRDQALPGRLRGSDSWRSIPRSFESLQWRLVGPHRGGRVVAVAGHPTERHDVLLRRLRRRRLEDDRRRHLLARTSPTASSTTAAVGALAVAQSDPNVDLRRHRRDDHPRQRLARRRRLQVDRRRPHLGATSGCATPATSARVRVHPHDPDLVYVAALGHACGPERGARRLPLAATAARPGSRSSSRATDAGAIDLVDGPEQPAHPLRRHLGGAALRRGA